MEEFKSVRPYGPNQITEVIDDIGDNNVSPSLKGYSPYKRGILSSMACVDLSNMSLYSNGSSACMSCDFGPNGSRAMCSRHPEFGSVKDYLVLPQDYESFSATNIQHYMIFTAIETLKRCGYTAIPRSSLDMAENGGIGFDTDCYELADKKRKATQIAKSFGIEVPVGYDVNNLMVSNDAVVVKNIKVHRGCLKFLLTDREMKAKFLTWVNVSRNLNTLLMNLSNSDFLGVIRNSVNGLLRYDGARMDMSNSDFIAEEYIQSPSNYASSFRIITSGYGDIIYSKCLVSDRAFEDRELIDDSQVDMRLRLNNARQEVGDKTSLTSAYKFSTFLLTHPDSPLFLGTHDIVSNSAKGGISIPLEGGKVENKFLRERLVELKIDPDNAQLPDYIEEFATRLGMLYRHNSPYIGIDLVKNETGYSLLEANCGAALDASLVKGGVKGMSQIELQQLLLLQIARNKRKNKKAVTNLN